jgi:signal transduction histidine kinase
MATYQLNGYTLSDKSGESLGTPEFDDKMLLSNVHWFISVRWIVIAVFIISGVTGIVFSDSLSSLGFILPVVPLFYMAGILIIINTGFFLISRNGSIDKHRKNSINLWVQIILDLVFVTSLVYFVGSTDTFIPFIYLIHIVISCIFFPKSKSIYVVCIAACFYLGCVYFQSTGFLHQQTILYSSTQNANWTPVIRLIFAFSAIIIWFILWYFISTLSSYVRERDSFLSIANHKLELADIEKTRQVLITTHDLKAPFAGIESNISVLKYLHWEELPDSCRKLLDKIEIRSKTLRERIKQILDLGNLRTKIDQNIESEQVNLKKIIDNSIGDLADQILDKNIDLNTNIQDLLVNSNEEKLQILFSNLVSNAVFYTPANGRIEIKMEDMKDEIKVTVKDTGIGIAEKYLDKIFNEYFRTPEAVQFNKMSTGLGLQIVKTIAEKLSLSVFVESEKDIGTTFTVGIKH